MYFLSRLLQTLFLSRIFYIILQNCCHYKQLMLYFVKLLFSILLSQKVYLKK